MICAVKANRLNSHGFHASCLKESLADPSLVEHYKNCEDWRTFNNATVFISYYAFEAPELPPNLIFTQGLGIMLNVGQIWTKALRAEHSNALSRLIAMNMPITMRHSVSKKLFNLINIAAAEATPANLNFLLDSGIKFYPDVKKTLNSGFKYAFMVKDKNKTNAKIFLERGADINDLDENIKKTALGAAVLNEDVDGVKYLIALNADLNLGDLDDYGSPLHLAVYRKNAEIVDLLLKTNRIDLNITNKNKQTPFIAAFNTDSVEILKIFLDYVPRNFEVSDCSILQFAIVSGSYEIIKYLIKLRFLPVNRDGIVSHMLHMAIVPMIIRISSETSSRTSPIASNDSTSSSDTSNDSASSTIELKPKRSLEIVKLLLENGADPYEPMLPSVFHFLKKDHFPTYANRLTKFDPPIVVAILTGNFEVFKLLLDTGMNLNFRIFNSSTSLLHLVCELGNVQMAAYLISSGADIHMIDYRGHSPFQYNNQEFNVAVFELL